MKILFVADGRSPIATNWIRYFIQQGQAVHLVSTFPSQPLEGLASYHEVLVAFSKAKESRPSQGLSRGDPLGRPSWGWQKLVPVGLRTTLRQWAGPLTLSGSARKLREITQAVQPDLVHAMRIPYEGMLSALAAGPRPAIPLLISIWGNDFTLHAPSTPLMSFYTRLALRYASALHTDCARDQGLAVQWGFPLDRPSVVLPGAGGVQADLFYPPEDLESRSGPPIIINPRGFRAYVRSDSFFRAVPLVLAKYPHARFLCTSSAGEPQALRWVEELGIAQYVNLLPPVARSQMAELFRQAWIAVSPSTHDGTPNTLLEAMASGCFPVAGDIESLREWITPGENGLLVDPADPQALASAMLTAIEDAPLRRRAALLNRELIMKRADYHMVMSTAADFYQTLLNRKT